MAKNIKMIQSDISIEQGFERLFRWCRLKGFSDYSIEFYDEIRMNFALFQNLDAPIDSINKAQPSLLGFLLLENSLQLLIHLK